MKISPKKKAGFVAFALLMLLLFNAPIMTAINRKASEENSPALLLYISTIWILCILIISFIVSFRSFDRHKKS